MFQFAGCGFNNGKSLKPAYAEVPDAPVIEYFKISTWFGAKMQTRFKGITHSLPV